MKKKNDAALKEFNKLVREMGQRELTMEEFEQIIADVSGEIGIDIKDVEEIKVQKVTEEEMIKILEENKDDDRFVGVNVIVDPMQEQGKEMHAFIDRNVKMDRKVLRKLLIDMSPTECKEKCDPKKFNKCIDEMIEVKVVELAMLVLNEEISEGFLDDKCTVEFATEIKLMIKNEIDYTIKKMNGTLTSKDVSMFDKFTKIEDQSRNGEVC